MSLSVWTPRPFSPYFTPLMPFPTRLWSWKRCSHVGECGLWGQRMWAASPQWPKGAGTFCQAELSPLYSQCALPRSLVLLTRWVNRWALRKTKEPGQSLAHMLGRSRPQVPSLLFALVHTPWHVTCLECSVTIVLAYVWIKRAAC